MNLSIITSHVGKILSPGSAPAQPEEDAPRLLERRAYPRPKVRFAGTLDVEEQRIPVRGIDLHRAGARVAADYPLPTGTVVFFFAKSHGLMGWAKVQWGAWHGHKFHLGLVFRNPLMRAEVGSWQFSSVDGASNGVFVPPPAEVPPPTVVAPANSANL